MNGAGAWPRLGAVAGLGGLAAAGFVVGVLLAFVGGLAGPAVMVGLPLSAVAVAAAWARPVLAVGLVLALLPVGLVAVPGLPLGLQVVHLSVLVLSAAVLLRRLSGGHPPLAWSGPLGWGVALAVWALLATLSAVDTTAAIKQDANLVIGLLLALLAVTVVRDLAEVRALSWVLVAAGAVITAPSLLSAGDLSVAYGGAVVSNRLQGSFAQPNELGAFAMVVVLVGAGLLLGARSLRERLLAGLLVLPSLAALSLSLSRGAWIGAALAAAALVVLLPQARRAVLLAGVPLLLLAAALGAFAPEQPQVQVVGARLESLRDPAANPYDGRPRIWAEARREVALEPWTGHGPGSFPLVSTRSASDAQTVRADHAHDVLLTVAAEAGLPAAALLVGLTVAVGFAVRDALPRLPLPDAAVAAGLAAACVGIAGQGIVDFVQRNPVLLMTDFVVLGLLLAAVRSRPSTAASRPERRQRPASPGVRSAPAAGRARAG